MAKEFQKTTFLKSVSRFIALIALVSAILEALV
jgi:hypothetical protein